MKQAQRSNSSILKFLPGRLINPVLVFSLAAVSMDTTADTIFKCNSNNGTPRYQSTKCEQAEELGKWNVKAVTPLPPTAQTNVYYVSVKKGAGGVFRLDGEINGVGVNMVVDTGAAFLSIPSPFADQLNLEKGNRRELMSANGLVQGYDTVVKTLRIGNIVINNIQAVISPDTTGVLLGQSVLGMLKVEQLKDELRLSAP